MLAFAKRRVQKYEKRKHGKERREERRKTRGDDHLHASIYRYIKRYMYMYSRSPRSSYQLSTFRRHFGPRNLSDPRHAELRNL
jgi:hypothetical protein